jgi:hypothetical protein
MYCTWTVSSTVSSTLRTRTRIRTVGESDVPDPREEVIGAASGQYLSYRICTVRVDVVQHSY